MIKAQTEEEQQQHKSKKNFEESPKAYNFKFDKQDPFKSSNEIKRTFYVNDNTPEYALAEFK